MRGNVVRIGATAAGALLALGLFATPPAGATGSGKHSRSDRSEVRSDRSERSERHYKERRFDTKHRTGGRGDDRAMVKSEQLESDRKERCRREKEKRTTPPSTAPTAVAGADAETDDEACRCPKDGVPTTDTPDATVTVDAVAAVPAAVAAPDVAVLAADTPTTTTTVPTEVMGAALTNPAALEPTTTTTTPTEVLGETLEQPGASTLPRTGAGIAGLALIGGLLFGGGRLLVLARRFLRIG